MRRTLVSEKEKNLAQEEPGHTSQTTTDKTLFPPPFSLCVIYDSFIILGDYYNSIRVNTLMNTQKIGDEKGGYGIRRTRGVHVRNKSRLSE